MSDIEQIQTSLSKRFQKDGERGRIVFWRDAEGEYADVAEKFCGSSAADNILKNVSFLRYDHDPFRLRYQILKESPNTKFLVYLPDPEPVAKDNWLLDMELAYGPAFSADKLTMIANELPDAPATRKNEWLQSMRQTPQFFNNKERVHKLSASLAPDDDVDVFKAKMVSVLLGIRDGEHSMERIWRTLLEQYADDDDSGIKDIEKMGLGGFHWNGTRQIYRFATDNVPLSDELGYEQGKHPKVRDFVIWLFRLGWNGFVTDNAGVDTYANIRRDFNMWANDRTFTETFKELADKAENDLDIISRIDGLELKELSKHGIFRSVEERIVTMLYERLGNSSIADDDLQRIVKVRRGQLWYDDYENDYETISAASALRKTLEENRSVIGHIASPAQGFELYTQNLYHVDTAYRRFVTAWKETDETRPAIYDDLENQYHSFQSDLGAAWQKQVDTLDEWKLPDIPAQSDFYAREVEPRTSNGRRLAVIISDALRYEVADEFARKLVGQGRFSADIEAQYSVLPSYTQLGMAALLPHKSLALSPSDHYGAVADGHNASGVGNRDSILSGFGGHAVQADQLLAMKRDEVRELVKSSSVLYVYHNQIDAKGDNAKTEDEAFEACSKAITELIQLVKTLTNANISNLIVTADHGFLYQDHKVADAEWLSEQPQGDHIWQKKRRFVIGSNLAENRAFITYTAKQAGLDNESDEKLTIQMPNSIQRLRMQGAGVRYVHGGAALQEIVVPVVSINKGRNASGDVRPVGFKILQQEDRITTGQLTVEFVQNEAVGGKVSPRILFAALYGASDGSLVPISNEVPISFDSTDRNIAQRHRSATFLLTDEANRFNGSNVELRLRERIGDSSQMRFIDDKATYLLKRGLIVDDGFDFN